MKEAIVIISTPSNNAGEAARYTSLTDNLRDTLRGQQDVRALAENVFVFDISGGLVNFTNTVDMAHRAGFVTHTFLSSESLNLIKTVGR